MANERKKHWTEYLPCVEIRLRLGPVHFHTAAMYERMDTATVEAFWIEWTFFKWNGRFRLFYKLLPY